MSDSRLLTIEYLPLAALQPYERNARTHSAEQVKQIAASMRAFGWTNPILVDEGSLIIAGHGRLAAATELGLARWENFTGRKAERRAARADAA